jgi:hypothetical protein
MSLACDRYPQFDFEKFFVEYAGDYRVFDSHDHSEVAINCPCCEERGEPTPDKNKKLWINLEKGTFYCYRCQWAGQILRLVQQLTNCTFTNAIKLLRGSALNPFEHLDLKLVNETFEPDREKDDLLKDLELPYGYSPIEGPQEYLKKRGVPWEYASRNEWGISDAGYTKDRIIVPTFMEQRLVFWQARATWDGSGKEFKKVLNPSGVSARCILYNYDTAKEFETIVLTEGFMDAVKVGPDAVATNGKRLHPQQVEFLKKTKAKEIVIMWDADAWTDHSRRGKRFKPCSIQRATELLRAYSFEVRAVKMPVGRDPGSFKYRSKTLRRLIEKAKVPIFGASKSVPTLDV